MNKNVMIFGDSYSTYDGYIPKGYAVYYADMECDNTDVRKVEETWWHRVCSDLSLHLVRNDSWSGSTLCNTGYNGDCSETNSFIYRMETLEEKGFSVIFITDNSTRITGVIANSCACTVQDYGNVTAYRVLNPLPKL